jgi:CIC family chloride channel protein
MASAIELMGNRARQLLTRLLARIGFDERTILVPMAVLVGVITAAAAVAFHELVQTVREVLYPARHAEFLYGKGVSLLILLPAAGGLVVGVFNRYVIRGRSSGGMADVVESVSKGAAVLRTRSALETIFASGITIGSGGSAGAEGPIVQIGAAIASGIGKVFQVSRQHYPVLIGCGTAAGISAIFNSPMGGVLFTLEVILLDFSIRTFTPVVLASVIANVATRRILQYLEKNPDAAQAIFALPETAKKGFPPYPTWGTIGTFFLLGLACGVVGIALTRLMYATEHRFGRLKMPRPLKPALGGALLGVLGVIYVIIFGWLLLGRAKPFLADHYAMPAFFGDGYGAVMRMLQPEFYAEFPASKLLLLMVFLVGAKVVGTALTLGSGGNGGVIAPSLVLGATTGALVGLVLRSVGLSAGIQPHVYALVGMGAVLAAVVHAPLASLLILFDITQQPNVIVPGMLATIVATGTGRLLYPESIYSLSLRSRGVRVGTSADLTLLRRLTVEDVGLDPVTVLPENTPLQRLVQLSSETGAHDFVLSDESGDYCGMVVGDDLRTAMVERESIPLLNAADIARPNLPPVRNSDDLARVMATFSEHDVSKLPVSLSSNPGRVVGLVSRSSLMRRYHRALSE